MAVFWNIINLLPVLKNLWPKRGRLEITREELIVQQKDDGSPNGFLLRCLVRNTGSAALSVEELSLKLVPSLEYTRGGKLRLHSDRERSDLISCTDLPVSVQPNTSEGLSLVGHITEAGKFPTSATITVQAGPKSRAVRKTVTPIAGSYKEAEYRSDEGWRRRQ